MKIQFLGATQTVTGSKYLITLGNKHNILIDCGLFQGLKELRLRNWAIFPVDPATIDAVVLTHAHIDHSGYLPLLAKNGFKGHIYCTPPTKDLCSIMLPDSGFLHEEEARRANKYGYSRHKPAFPLYTMEDAKNVMSQFVPIDFGQEHKINEIANGDVTMRFNRAGHILGAASVIIRNGKTKILFSGDLGRPYDPIMRTIEPLAPVDYLVVESTYGDRIHDQTDPEQQLGEIIRRTAKRGGTIIIPAFAVGRTQNILYYIYQLQKAGQIYCSQRGSQGVDIAQIDSSSLEFPQEARDASKRSLLGINEHCERARNKASSQNAKSILGIPVFLDSPLATDATAIFEHYKDEHRLSKAECEAVCHIAHCVNSVEESKLLDSSRGPKIIVSASGMAEGGRVLHHLRVFAGDSRNTILFCGYQAAGTRGEKMLRGINEIKLFGEIVRVNAEIVALSNISAHADSEEILNWLRTCPKAPRQVFITHGEPDSSEALKTKIERELHWHCTVPQYLWSQVLDH